MARAVAPTPTRFLSSSAALRSSDFTNILADAPRPAIQVATSSSKGFTLTDGLIISTPTIFLNGCVFLWNVDRLPEGTLPGDKAGSDWAGWDTEKLKVFEIVTPRPEILLVGTGSRSLFAPPAFKKYLNGLGIQVDVLDSKSACSTYNLLTEEGRSIAALLSP